MKTTKMLAILVLALGLAAEVTKANFTFGETVNLGPPINTEAGEVPSSFSSDGLELYFMDAYTFKPGNLGGHDIWVAKRSNVSDPWGGPVNLGPPVNTEHDDAMPSLSADGLTLYFGSKRPGGQGDYDIWVTRRDTIDDDWGTPVNLGPPVNGPSGDTYPTISIDGLSLYFSSYREGGYGNADTWVATRATTDDPWGEPVNLGEAINSPAYDSCPYISPNGLVLFFHSQRAGGHGAADVWMATRPSTSDPWDPPVPLSAPINSGSADAAARISADGLSFYFCSNRPGGEGDLDIMQAPILPIVDLNGDRVVDSADMCIIVDHWGEDYPLCDIGPTPLGDGIVDVHDLIVLAEYLFEDYRLIAHLKLDETEGIIAQDSAGDYRGALHGEPLWQSSGGMIDGALQLDGIDDCVETNFILNPADGPFSVFAWLKGGVPGQVIISQADTTIDTPVGPSTNPGSTWLGANPSDGRLMTGLMDIYFGPLESESVITDGQWHHIGLVYDLTAMKRHLYVDGAEVVVDAGYVGGVQSSGGLYIGAGQDLGTGTFFSGLIDDVRIYDAALTAEEIEALTH